MERRKEKTEEELKRERRARLRLTDIERLTEEVMRERHKPEKDTHHQRHSKHGK